MFETLRPYSSFSIKDSEAAKTFYAETLGLNVSEETMLEGERMLTLNFDGGGKVLLYPKPDHTPATFTVLNLPVKEIHSAVKDLKARGIKFEHYEGNDEEEINHHCGPSIAWFKDPSGNCISVTEEQLQFTTIRFFPVPREKVFNYFTDKNLLQQWAYPEGMTLRVPQFEARTGGQYRFEHTNSSGVWVCTGSISEFVPNQKLVQADTVRGPDGKIMFEKLEAETVFKDAPGGTEVSVTQRRFKNQEALDGCKIGWEQSFKHLSALFHL